MVSDGSGGVIATVETMSNASTVCYVGAVVWNVQPAGERDDDPVSSVEDSAIITDLYYSDGWFYYHTSNDSRFQGMLTVGNSEPVFPEGYAKCTYYELEPIIHNLHEAFRDDIRDDGTVREMMATLMSRAEWVTIVSL